MLDVVYALTAYGWLWLIAGFALWVLVGLVVALIVGPVINEGTKPFDGDEWL